MIRPWLLAFAVGTASTLAHALPLAHCVVARKPTREQMKENRAIVERLLDEYDAAARSNGAWEVALGNVYNAFPVPTVNLQIAQHHDDWKAPEKKLIAYVEATRQDPTFYADPEAIKQKIKDAEQNLIPSVKRAPILIVEASGIVRRQSVDGLAIHVNGRPCNGELVEEAKSTEVSWNFQGTRNSATFTPEQIQEGLNWCVAIEGAQIKPCNPSLGPDPQPDAPPALPTQPAISSVPPASEMSAAIPWTPPAPPPDGPSLDYTVAALGGSVALAGFALALWADKQVDSSLNDAAGGCWKGQCTKEATSAIEHAMDYRNTYFVSTAVGFAGVAVLLVSPYRYYRAWFLPSSVPSHRQRSEFLPNITPQVTPQGSGLAIQGRF